MMGKLAKLLIAVFLILSTSCQSEQLQPYEKYVDEIVNALAKDMQKEYGLVCIGSGGMMPKDVEEISMHFHLYRRVTIEEARELMVIAKEKLADKVNAHKKIRPYLREYPFTVRRSDITIAFHKPHSDSYYLDGSVAIACTAAHGEKISYEAAELQMRTLSGLLDEQGNVEIPEEIVEREVFIPLLEESYDEALQIVKSRLRAITAMQFALPSPNSSRHLSSNG